MIDPWILVMVIFALCVWSAIILSLWRKAKKSENVRRENENMRQEYFVREGMYVNARVLRVVLHEDRKQYEVFASWRSRETGRVFNFHEICMFPLDAGKGFRPKIEKGRYIDAWVILDQPSNFMKQDW